MTEKMFRFALRKSATLFFVAVFIVSTGFNLSMPFVVRAEETNEIPQEIVTEPESTEVQDEAVDTDNTKETEDPTESDILGVTSEETVQNMITFCHLPPGNEGNPQTLTLPEHVYIDQGHPNHEGDHLGECTEEDEPQDEICGDQIDNDGDDLIDENCVTEDECEIDPKKCEEGDKTATVIAHKVRCDSEADLPDWGNNGPSVTSTTAQEYVDNSEGKCELVDWTFEWMPYDGTPVADNDATHIDGWTTFTSGTPTEITLGERVWVREQMQDGYIPFSGDTTNDPYDTISAEFYCASDVLHYDNLEFIDPVGDTTYHCVGFNVLEEREQEVCEVTGPNLVKNGSFETPIPDENEGEWEIFNSIYGWLGGKVEIINGYDGWLADHLKRFATLDTCNCSDSSIYQNIATIPGKSYKVSFAHSAQPGYDATSNSIEFLWDENSEGIFSDDGTNNTNTSWKTKNFEFIADGASTEIRFTGLGLKDGAGNFLDDVVVAQCNPEECEEGPTWANEVITSSQGKRNDGVGIAATRSQENSVLGAPNGDGYAQTGFFSLGIEGSITVKFDKYIENVDGEDLSFHEVTNERDTYPEENAKVEVSQDGVEWKEIGEVSSLATGGVDYLDFDSTGWSWIQYVRITDTTDFSLNNIAIADGYDVDAIDATNGLCREPDDKTTTLTVIKNVVGGTADADDFSLIVNSTGANPGGQFPGSAIGTVVALVPGELYGVAESVSPGYTPSFGEGCSGTLEEGEDAICIVTNTFNEDEGGVCIVGEELIENGSFELPEMINANGWDIFPSGTLTLEWLATWLAPAFDAPVTANIEIQEDGLMGWTTPYGDQWVELDADYGFNTNESSATRISQDIETEIGATYKIKYAFGARPGVVNNSLEVKADASVIDTQSEDGTGDVNINWVTDDDTVTFIATDTTTTISFENTDTSDSLGSFLDEVSVKCIEDGSDGEDDGGGNGGDNDEEDDSTSGGGGGGGGGSSSRSGSVAGGEVLGDATAEPEVLGVALAATGTENVSYIVLSGLILAFLVATKRRNSII